MPKLLQEKTRYSSKKRKYYQIGFCVLSFSFYSINSLAQQKDSLNKFPLKNDTLPVKQYSAEVGIMPVITSNNTVPFWMRSNQYGSIPLDGLSGSVVASAKRIYTNADTAKKKLVDWGFGFDARLNAGNNSNVQLIEAYVKGRLSIFQLKVGRSKDITGIVDSSLSVGAFSVSGNALGIPKIELSIPEYWDIPYTKGVVALKGSFTHGWFGQKTINTSSEKVDAYYHQTAIYGRIGKPTWKVKFYGGINHQAMWGGESKLIGNLDLSTFQILKYITLGKTYDVTQSKIGNQLGSIDQAVEIDLKSVSINAYHQFIYDIGAIAYLANLKDGLYGASITNKSKENTPVRWNKFLFEFFNSKSQAGERDAKVTPSGDEDYYNNYQYPEGWSYKGENLGNPILTQSKYAREDLVKRDFFVNNRVTAFNIGAEGNVYNWQLKTKLTFSRNFGTYGTSPTGRSQNGNYSPPPPPYFQAVNQFSGYVEASRPLKNNYYIGAALAIDNGGLLYNSGGGFLKLSKRW